MIDPLLIVVPGLDGEGTYMRGFLGAYARYGEAQLCPLPPHLFDYRSGADELCALLPTNRPFVIVAESFAGPLALAIAQMRLPTLQGVVLSASFSHAPMPRLLLEALAHALPRLHDAGTKWLARTLLAGDPHSDIAEQAIRSFEKLPPATKTGRIQSIARADADEALRTCPVPLVLLTPTHDRLLWRDYARPLPASMREHRVESPHMLLAHAADTAADHISRFIQGLKSPIPSA